MQRKKNNKKNYLELNSLLLAGMKMWKKDERTQQQCVLCSAEKKVKWAHRIGA